MKQSSISEILADWIGEDPSREALIINEAPIAESTLKAILRGRYVPAPRLEKALRTVIDSTTRKVAV